MADGHHEQQRRAAVARRASRDRARRHRPDDAGPTCREPLEERGQGRAPPASSAPRRRPARWPAPPPAADRCPRCRGRTARSARRWRAAPRGRPRRRRRRRGRARCGGPPCATADARPTGASTAIGPLVVSTGMAMPTTATPAAMAASVTASDVNRGATKTSPAGPSAPSTTSSPAARIGASSTAGSDEDDRLRGGQPEELRRRRAAHAQDRGRAPAPLDDHGRDHDQGVAAEDDDLPVEEEDAAAARSGAGRGPGQQRRQVRGRPRPSPLRPTSASMPPGEPSDAALPRPPRSSDRGPPGPAGPASASIAQMSVRRPSSSERSTINGPSVVKLATDLRPFEGQGVREPVSIAGIERLVDAADADRHRLAVDPAALDGDALTRPPARACPRQRWRSQPRPCRRLPPRPAASRPSMRRAWSARPSDWPKTRMSRGAAAGQTVAVGGDGAPGRAESRAERSGQLGADDAIDLLDFLGVDRGRQLQRRHRPRAPRRGPAGWPTARPRPSAWRWRPWPSSR